VTAYLGAFILPVLLWPLRSRSRTAYIVILSLAWALFAGLRSNIGGTDYLVYRDYYASLSGFGFGNGNPWEPLFKLLTGILKSAGLPWHGYLSVVALLGILPAVAVIEENSRETPLGLFVYGIEFMLYGSFVILRQGLALGLAFLVIDYVRKGKIVPALVACLLATGFHYSAILLLLYLPFSLSLHPKLRTGIWAAAGLLGLATVALVMSGAISAIGTPFTNRLISYLQYIGGATLNPLNVLEILGISYLLLRYGQKAPDIYYNGFFIFMIFALMATLEAIFVRMGSYFKIVLPLFYPILAAAEPEGALERRLGRAWLQVAIFVYYLAKITRWLILTRDELVPFLPYRAVLGG